MSTEYLLEAVDITKVFPGTKALAHVKLKVKRGEVHALCGENGAGKSTLMNIIGGVIPATEGKILFEGKEVKIPNPRVAQELGIGFVHQELCLCDHLTVAENIYIGRLPKKGDKIDFQQLYQDADEMLQKFNASFDSKVVVGNLNVSEKQIVEIAKAVSLNCKFLILDEPTSTLTNKETTKLFEIVKDLKNRGISILYISHRLAEVFEICDTITIFRDGTYVTEMNVADITTDDIISAMVGRKIENMYPPRSSRIGEVMLSAEHLTRKDVFEDISFTLKRGEILGFAGLVGAGRSEIMRSLCGIDPLHEGKIFLEGKEVKFKNYREAINSGIMYLTEDRKSQGLFLSMSIMNNISVVDLKRISNGLFLDEKKEKQLASEYVSKLDIKVSSVEALVSSMSGGNQQKVVVAKWLCNNPKIIIMDEPTRGIDVGAKSEIHILLRNLSEAGVGVIIVSSELPEVMGVCDKIYVIHEGHLSGSLDAVDFSQEKIMKYASGQ